MSTARFPRCKAVLFCRACDHAAPVGTGWRVTETHDRYDVTCPECGRTAVRQPRL